MEDDFPSGSSPTAILGNLPRLGEARSKTGQSMARPNILAPEEYHKMAVAAPVREEG